jgi:4-hydroxybenzoate polyprenyltransferase
MSLAYSIPPVRLKAVAGADWAINIVGVGILTPFAGWAASGTPLRPDGIWIMLGFGCLFGSLYPLTQIYQLEEDTKRGDRTLVRMLGVGRSLTIALTAAILAFSAFARALWIAGPTSTSITVLSVAAAAWGGILISWLARHRGMTSHQHKLGMYRALAVWGLTDVVVLVAFAV